MNTRILTMTGGRCCMPSEARALPASLLVIGDPQSKRAALLSHAAADAGLACEIVSWIDVLNGDVRIVRTARGGALLRIESPAAEPETMRLILAAGIEPMEEQRRIPIGRAEIARLSFGRGEIIHPLQWYLGFERTLRRLSCVAPAFARSQRTDGRQLAFAPLPGPPPGTGGGGNARACWMNTPRAIATAFDKRRCRELWEAAGVPMAAGHAGIATYSQLRGLIHERHARVFIKLRYGYSAMGAVALEWRDRRARAITTVETVWQSGRPRLFVSKRPRVLQREFEIEWLVDTLGMEEIVVEDWLPKARWRGKSYDLRIVVIDGRAQHVVGRAHGSPFTNLNLDAERIPREGVADDLGEGWPMALAAAERAAAEIPGAGYLGVDVLVRPCRRRFAVLEANAFGDYLPGLEFEGRSTYAAELRECLMRYDRNDGAENWDTSANVRSPPPPACGHLLPSR